MPKKHLPTELKLHRESRLLEITFDDGHDTGLYDWNYLYTLGNKRQELWELYLERLERAGETRNGPDPFDALEE